tara:strand:+ start:9041 stop:9517 length:477 start_codon:yes stop_codon:yes gene_type:complete
MINDNNIVCSICDTNNYSKNLKCKTCSKSICIECCCCLPSRKTSILSFDDIHIKYKCPYCRDNNSFDINNFEKDELLKIYKNNLKSYIKVINDFSVSRKENKELENTVNNLKSMNLINENQIDKISNSLKHVIEINKSNSRSYDLVIDKYKNLIINRF